MKNKLILTIILLGFTTVSYSQNTSTSTSTTSTTDSTSSELDSSLQQQERQQSPSSGAIQQRTGTSSTPATSTGRTSDSTLPSTSDSGTVSGTAGSRTPSSTNNMNQQQRSDTATTTKKMSAQDTALIKDIRSRINADKDLSTRAKNITIISDNGRVILKGAVANSQEKSKVEEIAKKASGTKSVENLTEVGTY